MGGVGWWGWGQAGWGRCGGLEEGKPWPGLLLALPPTDGALSSAVAEPHVNSGQRTACVVLPRVSARAQEDAEWWHRFAEEWLHRLQGSLSVAPLFCDLGELAQESFLPVLQGKAPATLRRHLLGWNLWSTVAGASTTRQRTRWVLSSWH